MTLFEAKNITPMLIADNQPPFDSDDYVFELKWDGIRCLVYLDVTDTELRNKRNKRLNAIYPEVCGLHALVKQRCILDGELFAMVNGKPDFGEVQRRSLMNDPFKIKQAANRQPISFIAYDVIFIGDESVCDRTLEWRGDALTEVVKEPAMISRRIERDGIAMFNAAAKQGLEGIVAKRKDSLYFPGKRTKHWIKMKALLDEDFFICGYIRKDTVASVVLGAYQNGKLTYQGTVALGVSHGDLKLLMQTEALRANDEIYNGFPDLPGCVWLKPRWICTVQYMERTKNGGLRQPVFKGVRLD